jgi:hypothetical protein
VWPAGKPWSNKSTASPLRRTTADALATTNDRAASSSKSSSSSSCCLPCEAGFCARIRVAEACKVATKSFSGPPTHAFTTHSPVTPWPDPRDRPEEDEAAKTTAACSTWGGDGRTAGVAKLSSCSDTKPPAAVRTRTSTCRNTL